MIQEAMSRAAADKHWSEWKGGSASRGAGSRKRIREGEGGGEAEG